MIGEAIAQAHPLPDGAAARFDRFHALLQEWNQRMDLTSSAAAESALVTHYLDSLTALPYLPSSASVVDIGTGAGFPGVPLLLARPDLRMTLLDALQKRVAFLAFAAEATPFQAECVHERAEDFAKQQREAFDVALSRAVASLPVLLEWALPLVRVGGQCLFWKGNAVAGEMADAMRVAPLLGGGEVRVVEAGLQGRANVLVFVDKVAPTAARFPRKAGMAFKRPLAGR